MVRAVGGEDLRPPGVQPGHPYGVLDRLGATRREQDVPEALRSDLDDEPGRLAADVVGVAGGEGAETVGLVLDRLDDARVLVAQVGEDQLRAEVQVATTVGVDRWLPAPPTKVGRCGSLNGPGVEDQVVELHLVSVGCSPSRGKIQPTEMQPWSDLSRLGPESSTRDDLLPRGEPTMNIKKNIAGSPPPLSLLPR